MKIFEKLRKLWSSYKAGFAEVNWSDVWLRAFKTFVETAITCAVTKLAGLNFAKQYTESFWIGFFLSVGSAGVSAVWNGVLRPLFKVGSTPIPKSNSNG